MTTQKQYEKIRAIATTVKGDKFAVAEWEKNVQIWDINNGLVSKFSTDLIVGMSKAISISENGKEVAIAGYDHKTVTLYNAENGEIIWQRKDIKKPSTAKILNCYQNLIYVDTENQGAFFLNKKTGETVEKLRGIEFIRENPYSNIDQFEKTSTSNLVNRMDRKTIKSITHKTFAILDACFSIDKIVCAYSTNPLVAISLLDFETVWTTNVIRIRYHKA